MILHSLVELINWIRSVSLNFADDSVSLGVDGLDLALVAAAGVAHIKPDLASGPCEVLHVDHERLHIARLANKLCKKCAGLIA